VRAAVRLFATPLPPKWLQRRTPWDADWHVEQWPFEEASLTLYAQPVAPHAPVALLVHGWGGHAGQLQPLAEALAQHGLRPVLLEMPAHGRSAGTTSNLPQFARAIEYAVGRLQQQGHAVACSRRTRWAPTPPPSRPAAAWPSASWCCWRRPPRRASTRATSPRCSA
jgi:pimeloyl-ACP methyl ester carboxylesterase